MTPNQGAVELGSSGAISGNIGSYAADSMVRRRGPPTPPPARAADSDTLDPGTVRASGPVYDKPVYHPRSRWQPSLASVGRRLATRRELLRDNFRVGDHPGGVELRLN